jgi:hypothetical protein
VSHRIVPDENGFYEHKTAEFTDGSVLKASFKSPDTRQNMVDFFAMVRVRSEQTETPK